MGREGSSPSGLKQAGKEEMFLAGGGKGEWQKLLNPALQGVGFQTLSKQWGGPLLFMLGTAG